MRACRPKNMKRRERDSGQACACRREKDTRPPTTSGFSFYTFFLPLGLPYVNWARKERCLFYLRSSLRSSDLPLFYFLRFFPSLFFSHRHFRLLFPILTTWHSFTVSLLALHHLLLSSRSPICTSVICATRPNEVHTLPETSFSWSTYTPMGYGQYFLQYFLFHMFSMHILFLKICA